MATDRSFGYFFAAVFAALGAYELWTRSPWGWAWLALAAALLAAATLKPALLNPANRAWFALGALLARVVNPIVLGVLFFLVITPMGWLMRAAGRRPLSLAFEPEARTYWIERTPAGPTPASMKDPF